MAVARFASFHRPSHDRAAGNPSVAGGVRWRVSGAAGNELLVWPDSTAAGPGAVADRLFAALGPKRILGHQSGHQHRRRGPGFGTPPPANSRRRPGLRPRHLDPVFRPARRGVAGHGALAVDGAHLPFSPPRPDGKDAIAEAGPGILAGPGVERRPGLSGGDGRGDGAGFAPSNRRHPRRAGRGIRSAGGCHRALFGSAARVVFFVHVSVS